MADTKRVLQHIAELYAKPRANQDIDDAIREMEEKLNARFAEYDKAFSDKMTVDLLKAVDDYWRFKNDKTRPTLAQILSMENADTTKKDREYGENESPFGSRRRVLICMRSLFDDFGLEAAQVYHNALTYKYGLPFPKDEIEIKSLFAEL